jgi:hypothetical protein
MWVVMVLFQEMTMYKVTFNGRKAMGGKVFKSYDEARQAVRRYLTKMFNLGKVERDELDIVNRTYTIGIYGFSIVNVAK